MGKFKDSAPATQAGVHSFQGENHAGIPPSILTRTAKTQPLTSLAIGIVLIPLGIMANNKNSPEGRMVSGGLIGGSIGFFIMCAWDAGRLRFVQWRQARNQHLEDSDEN